MAKTIRLDRIDRETFENYFHLDGPGWRLALESDAAGELDTALNKLEAVVLLNKLYMMNLQNRLMLELAPFGTDKVEHYFELPHEERGEYVVRILGKELAEQILRDTIAETREEAGIGSNDKVKGDA